MNWNLLLPEYPPWQPQRTHEEIRVTFFKCLKWQVEETLNPIECPYHYYCDSVYPGNYSPVVDNLVFVFIMSTYLATLVLMVMNIAGRAKNQWSKRYLLPSGPIALPMIAFALAKGDRINTTFPLSSTGPAILQLVQVSAIAFANGGDSDIKYVFFEASTISGILHASMYLDAVILPYYTGLDALLKSTLSRECSSCVCRNEELVVGGTLVSYTGWSLTTFMVVATLCWRVVCRLYGRKFGKFILVMSLLESSSLILIIIDCVYLSTNSPPERLMLEVAASGGSRNDNTMLLLALLRIDSGSLERLALFRGLFILSSSIANPTRDWKCRITINGEKEYPVWLYGRNSELCCIDFRVCSNGCALPFLCLNKMVFVKCNRNEVHAFPLTFLPSVKSEH